MFIHIPVLFDYGLLRYPKSTLANLLSDFQPTALENRVVAVSPPLKQINLTLLEVWSFLC